MVFCWSDSKAAEAKGSCVSALYVSLGSRGIKSDAIVGGKKQAYHPSWAVQPTTSTNMLVYEPLKNHDSFRFRKILPGSITDPIRCSLKTSRISRQQEKYLCLSYCWGEIKKLSPIICQSTEVFVTLTLFHALERLHLPC